MNSNKKLMSLFMVVLMLVSMLPTAFVGGERGEKLERDGGRVAHQHTMSKGSVKLPGYNELNALFERPDQKDAWLDEVVVERHCTDPDCSYSETLTNVAIVYRHKASCYSPQYFTFSDLRYTEIWAKEAVYALNLREFKCMDPSGKKLDHVFSPTRFEYLPEKNILKAIRNCTNENCPYVEMETGLGDNPGVGLTYVGANHQNDGSVSGEYPFKRGGFAAVAWEAAGKRLNLSANEYAHKWDTDISAVDNDGWTVTVTQICTVCGSVREASSIKMVNGSISREPGCTEKGFLDCEVVFNPEDAWAHQIYNIEHNHYIELPVNPDNHFGLEYTWSYDEEKKNIHVERVCNDCHNLQDTSANSISVTVSDYKMPVCGNEGYLKGEAKFDKEWANERFNHEVNHWYGKITFRAVGEHKWSDWTGTDATDSAPGRKTRNCSLCNSVEELIIPTLKPSGDLEIVCLGGEKEFSLDCKVKMGNVYYQEKQIGSFKGFVQPRKERAYIGLDAGLLSEIVGKEMPGYAVSAVRQNIDKIRCALYEGKWYIGYGNKVYLNITEDDTSLKLNVVFNDKNKTERFIEADGKIRLISIQRSTSGDEYDVDLGTALLKPVKGSTNIYTAEISVPDFNLKKDVNMRRLRAEVPNGSVDYQLGSVTENRQGGFDVVMDELVNIPVEYNCFGFGESDYSDYGLYITRDAVNIGERLLICNNMSQTAEIRMPRYSTDGKELEYGLELRLDYVRRNTPAFVGSDGVAISEGMLDKDDMSDGKFVVNAYKSKTVNVKTFWSVNEPIPENFVAEARIIDTTGKPVTTFEPLNAKFVKARAFRNYFGECSFNIPVTDKQGKPIDFSDYQVEIKTNNDTVIAQTRAFEGGFEAEFVYGTKADIVVEWDDSSNAKEERPATQEIHILRTIENEENYKLYESLIFDTSISDRQSVTKNLPGVDDFGVPYKYKIQVVGDTNKYYKDPVIGGNGINVFSVKNSIKPLRDITVVKKWNVVSDIPENIQVQLYASGEPVEGGMQVLSENNSWSYTYKNLFVYDDEGKKISYTAEEILPEDLKNRFDSTQTMEDDLITIFNKDFVFDITVKQVWSGGGLIPAEVIVELYANDKIVDDSQRKISKTEGWITVYKDLPINDAQGNKIQYQIKEKAVKNYRTSVSAMDKDNVIVITNTYIEHMPVTGDASMLLFLLSIASVALVVFIATVAMFKKEKD